MSITGDLAQLRHLNSKVVNLNFTVVSTCPRKSAQFMSEISES